MIVANYVAMRISNNVIVMVYVIAGRILIAMVLVRRAMVLIIVVVAIVVLNAVADPVGLIQIAIDLS